MGTNQAMGNERPLGRTVRVHGWKLATIMCAAALLLAIVGATSASAASNFCVGADPTNLCPDDWPQATDLADVQTLATDLTMNTIYVLPGTYTSPNGVNFLNKPVKILGVGATKPIITIAPSFSPGTSVITTANSNTSFDNLQIDMPASTGLTGITAALGGQLITNITINGPGADDSKGIVVSDASPRVRTSTINLGSGTSSAVVVDSSTSAIIDDVNVTHATNAVSLSSALNFKIRRMKSHSANGVVGLASSGTVSSSVIMPSSVGAENSGGKGVGASSTSGETSERARGQLHADWRRRRDDRRGGQCIGSRPRPSPSWSTVRSSRDLTVAGDATGTRCLHANSPTRATTEPRQAPRPRPTAASSPNRELGFVNAAEATTA